MIRWLLWIWLLLHASAVAAALPQLVLDVRLDPAQRRLEARAEVPMEGRQFRFALHPSLTVRRAEIDGRAVRVQAGPTANDLRQWRIDALQPGSRVRIDYDGELPALQRSDHRAVLSHLPPMASTEGSYLPADSGWYPQPSGAFSYLVHLSLPGAQRALVPGDLRAESLPPRETERYRASYEFPHPAEGIALMAGPWVLREKRHRLPAGEEVRVRTWFDPELDATPGLADGYLEDAARYLSRYSGSIGAYPWGVFSIVAAPLPAGFGMPALTYIGRDVLRLPFIRATSLGHEVLHNWWGNGVQVDASAGNWSEGLTTFMADYAYREDQSAPAAQEMRLAWLRDAASLPASERRALSTFRFRTHAAAASLGYGKAAMLFVMLRDDIGEQAFARGVRLFWERRRFRVASWQDLRAAFEEASGRSLERFFTQWLDRTDAPRVRVAAARRLGANTEITLEQDAPPFDLLVPLRLQREGGSQAHTVRLRERRRTVLINAEADSVLLDPELRLWRELDGARLPPIWREWIAARNPRMVVLSTDAAMQEAAQGLASALFEKPPAAARLGALRDGIEPVLVIGRHEEVDRALGQAGLPARPPEAAAPGTAQAWTIPQGEGAPLAVVSVTDAAALAALRGPLPHYGAQSWIVFEGRRATARGAWPVEVPAVPVRR